jgi:hypothetical protein
VADSFQKQLGEQPAMRNIFFTTYYDASHLARNVGSNMALFEEARPATPAFVFGNFLSDLPNSWRYLWVATKRDVTAFALAVICTC